MALRRLRGGTSARAAKSLDGRESGSDADGVGSDDDDDASNEDSDDEACASDDAGLGDVGKLTGNSNEILQALKHRLQVTSILDGHRLGRSLNGSQAYLSNGKLNETDRHFLKRHFEQALLAQLHTGTVSLQVCAGVRRFRI